MAESEPNQVAAQDALWEAECARRTLLSHLGITPLVSRFDPIAAKPAQRFDVPTGASDPLVTGDATFLSNLDGFINSNKCLAGQRGQISARNSCRTGFTNIVSVRLQQEIRAFEDKSIDLFLDIENFGNLINDDWGRVDSYSAPSNIALANVTIAGGQYVYAPVSAFTQVSAATIAPPPAIARIPSVYRVQFGIKFRF